MKKRVISLMTSILMIIAMMASTVSLAATGMIETNVIIHKMDITKLDADQKAKFPGKEGLDGTKYTGDEVSDGYFGTAEKLDGVVFTYWEVTEAQYKHLNETPSAFKTVEKVNEYLQDESNQGTDTGPTVDGKVEIVNLRQGYYWFVENKEKSNIGDGKVIGDEIAVPFGLKLPVYYETGNFNNTDKKLHVYPKNIVDEPPVDKFVTEEGNKVDSFDFGKPQTWIITNTVPEGIKDYIAYKFTDEIDTRLDFIEDSVKITVGGAVITADKIVKGTVPETGAEEGKIYVDSPTGTNGRKLTVDFKMYVKELDKLTEDKTVKIEFQTKINDTAIMGQDIPNDVDFEFGNNPDNIKHKQPNDKPKVYTGGKRFIKKDKDDSAKTLSGAEFVVSDGSGNYLVQDPTTGERTWKDFADKEEANKDPNIVKLTSGNNGEFEIKGLAYGGKGIVNDGTASKDYYLEEVKAPEGYALESEKIKFTVNKTSYFTNPDEINYESDQPVEGIPAEQLIVNNTLITIPQTGGMGTILFTVVGLALMTVAFIALRKRNNEQ